MERAQLDRYNRRPNSCATRCTAWPANSHARGTSSGCANNTSRPACIWHGEESWKYGSSFWCQHHWLDGSLATSLVGSENSALDDHRFVIAKHEAQVPSCSSCTASSNRHLASSKCAVATESGTLLRFLRGVASATDAHILSALTRSRHLCNGSKRTRMRESINNNMHFVARAFSYVLRAWTRRRFG